MTCDKPHMIKELSLAMNFITDLGAEKIASFLEYSGSALKTLSLYWNKIKYRGGLKIAESISNNETLKVLDLSWNLIGKWQLNNLGQLPVSKIMKKLKNQP
jgi:Ran GTPase-activating protein (RanGAP) involved in mRNA processing and transport